MVLSIPNIKLGPFCRGIADFSLKAKISTMVISWFFLERKNLHYDYYLAICCFLWLKNRLGFFIYYRGMSIW